MVISPHFDCDLPLEVTGIGSGLVRPERTALHLIVPASAGNQYHDAQITDYRNRRDFRWRPPLRMTVRAGFNLSAGAMVGTAGFGFWNHPYGFRHERFGWRLPKAIWFFFSAAPNNMRLAMGVGGPGWKAATLDATRWSFLALTPTAPIGMPLMRIPALYRRLWPVGQRALGVSEKRLDPHLLTEQHDYTLNWLPDRVMFRVDGAMVHEAAVAIRGALGFIAWIDNQYAVVTPQGEFRFGVSAVPRAQGLMLERIAVDTG